ncbi:MAG: DUF309 domain-containing protein [Nitrososphaerota archaeon]|nr:DUF309 domain-containing protein [Nitrososphaerota archaeon]MDG7024696.1 DUF309 domain-containing protein [Nitrososphaerota archaeon]
MRFLIRLRGTSVPGEKLLAAARTVAKTLGVTPRNPKWTSYGALELDVFTPSRADFELFVSAVKPLAEVEFTRDLNLAPQHEAEPRLFDEARRLFNAERFWECHEVLEGVWRTKQGAEKSLLQGVILVCAAFVHHQKGEEAVALGVLVRATKQLDFPGPEYGGFDVPKLKRNVDGIIRSREFVNFRV